MSLLKPGFANPVRDSQAVFRAVLDAMARPGRIHKVTGPVEPPAPLDRSTAALLLALVDADVPLRMDERSLAARDWVAFHCGTTPKPDADCGFAVALVPSRLADLFSGTDEEPESSATLLLQVDALGAGTEYRLEGPGLAAPSRLAVQGLGDPFVTDWEANRRLFPRGVDVILCAGDQLAALPRTVRLEAT